MVTNPNSKNPLNSSLPGSAAEKEEQIIQQVDPSLRAEERAFVLHYLRLAAMLLGSPVRVPAAVHRMARKEKPPVSGPRLERKAA